MKAELKQLKREVEPALRSVNAKQEYQSQIRQVVQRRKQIYDSAEQEATDMEIIDGTLRPKVGRRKERSRNAINELSEI